MTITSIEADHLRIELPAPLEDSTHGRMTHFELITVRLRDEQGTEGLGYSYTVGAGGGAVHSLIERDLAEVIRGQDESRIESLWERMWWHLHFVGRGGPASFAIAAIDVALWDLKARQQNVPLWRLLGGHDPQVAAYAGGIDLHMPIDELLAQTEANLAQGIRAIKMKVGRDRLSEDVERVAAMREMLGPDVPLMVDANMRWRIDQALEASRRLAAYQLFWLEEPIAPDDIAGHVRIEREAPLPIAAGENLHSLTEFRQLIAAGGVSFPEPDVATCGGITVWMKVAHLAEAHDLPVTSHGVHDLHVHLLAAVPNKSFLEIHGFGLERFIEQPMTFADGKARAPDRPGHGIAFDWGALAPFHV
ncbi:MAG: mandelate racemase/muconate lactonizing enzyme family protein [Kiloniellales bacterium]|nr:mandelate racemase/muconate lactonizing enzyme family protein [Kiloniellales bacterium]